ncbi:hypothetical protein MKQ70_07515 [Chitinophaga sedimenti]|uniref:hypothetical protein n=1 Tax=Chitinophaga sedimenti TaxID=2033606 RepID=UPI002006CA22|nr:hypothetical protein [Chitinophaga sedimenti]MCK7554858.1 hypothetical protein [Chitinophaga sedimenti]
MHATDLDFGALISIIDQQLSADGKCSVLLPYSEFPKFLQLAQARGFGLALRLDVQQSPRHGFFRTVGIFTRGEVVTQADTLLIYGEGNQYTDAFVALLKEYYLYL